MAIMFKGCTYPENSGFFRIRDEMVITRLAGPPHSLFAR
jgi:hypothetical protein